MIKQVLRAMAIVLVFAVGGLGCDDDNCLSGPLGGIPGLCPSPAGMPSPPDAGSTGGACLLLYNDALVSGDPCCYRQGGRNTCDQSISCNDRSGAGCCVIYASEITSGGSRCCRYESGQLGDDPSECQSLLAMSH